MVEERGRKKKKEHRVKDYGLTSKYCKDFCFLARVQFLMVN